MSRKHNTKHPERAASHYPARLQARGLSRPPALPTVESLRRRQASEAWLEDHPQIAANLAAYHGGGQ